MPVHGNAIEWTWFFSSMAGIVMAAIGTNDAIKDLKVILHSHLNGGRMLLAFSNLRCEMTRMLIQVSGFIAAVVNLYLPPPPDLVVGNEAMVTMGVALLTISIVTTVVDFMEFKERHALRQSFKEHHS